MLRATDERARLHVAMHMAADHIERHPEAFDFLSRSMPSCGTPGCALGWTAYFYEEPVPTNSSPLKWIAGRLGVSTMTFYGSMHILAGPGWTADSTLCARGMRLYADKHFAPVDA